MKLTGNQKLEHLMSELRRGYGLQEERKLQEALEVYRGVLEGGRRMGFTSAFALWNLAIASDYAGELDMAFDYIMQAIAADPLARPFRDSFDVIARRLREALAAPDREAGDPSTPRLYDLLVRAGEADVAAHAAMARWCVATGEVPRGLAIADAMTLLHPADRDAWLLKAEVARAAGKPDVAAMATAEAAGIEGEPVPFAVPGVARG